MKNQYVGGVRVEAWHPGDGLQCSACRQIAARPHSGAVRQPVAVVRSCGRGRVHTRVLCMDHLLSSLTSGEDRQANLEKRALEELAREHWDEYQGVLEKLREEAIERALEGLPESLVEEIWQRDREGDDPRVAEIQRLKESVLELERRIGELSQAG